MDWGLITGDALRALVGSEAIVFALAAIGLNVHFGYAGLLNFGQAAFLAVAAYGLATVVTTFGLPFWLGILVGFAGVILLAIAARHPDAAITCRLSGNRHDRGRRRSSG